MFKMPDEIKKLEANKWLGDKTGQGFYKKAKNAKGESEILTLDLKTFEYKPKAKAKFPTLETTKAIDNLKERFKVLFAGKDKAGEFYRDSFYGLFQYVSNRIPEIADELYKIDDAVCAGFGWDVGPFETWDAVGVEPTIKNMEAMGYKPKQWVYDMIAAGNKSFYKVEGGSGNITTSLPKRIRPFPEKRNSSFSKISAIKLCGKTRSPKSSISVMALSTFAWHSKSYTLGSAVIEGLNKAVDLAEKNYRGLVVGHQGPDFSLGANLGLVFMYAIEQDYDEIDFMVRAFQNSTMRLRYSSIPVVVCPQGRTLGGGCEMTLHADLVQASAETYVGLVEVGVGLIPGGGGTKEFTKRVSDSLEEGDVELNALAECVHEYCYSKSCACRQKKRAT
jgi:3-hydroxyacyl-CoA dehydrogenase